MYNSALEFEQVPFPLSGWNPPSRGLIYGILMKREDGEYRIIYIGQSENISVRGFENKRAYAQCLSEAGGLSNLYIAFHSMPSSVEDQRIQITHDLIRLREPVCNLETAQS